MLHLARNEPDELSAINHKSSAAPTPAPLKIDSVKILAEKIRVPKISAEIERPRLISHLENSLTQFSSTLVTGRTGTGKTTLAADFAGRENYAVAWFNVDRSDSDWRVFLGYLNESLRQTQAAESLRQERTQFEKTEVSSVTESLAALFSAVETSRPLLVVFDDLHAVFDAAWFGEFFDALLSLPPTNVRLLMLARSAPPFPLWRLRSKYVLDIVDEKLLAFTVEETIKLFDRYRLSEKAARVAHQRAYGRIAKLREIAEKKAFR